MMLTPDEFPADYLSSVEHLEMLLDSWENVCCGDCDLTFSCRFLRMVIDRLDKYRPVMLELQKEMVSDMEDEDGVDLAGLR